MTIEHPEDGRAKDAAKAFQDAWDLLSRLDAQRGRLPDPMSALPTDSKEFRVYAVCIDKLRGGLRLALQNTVLYLEHQGEWQIREAFLPPSAKFPTDDQTWLNRGGGPMIAAIYGARAVTHILTTGRRTATGEP
jgi:hypothetical protein